MNAVIAFSFLPPARTSARAFSKNPAAAMLLSILLHAMLGMAIVFAHGDGAGDGMPGEGTGTGSVSKIALAGRLTLKGHAEAGKHAASSLANAAFNQPARIAPSKKEAGQTREADTAPISQGSGTNVPPLPVEMKPEKREASPQSARAQKQTVAATLKPANSPQHSEKFRAPGNMRTTAGQEAGAEGTGDGGTPGGGSGMHTGAGGNTRGAASRGTGLFDNVDSKPKVLSRSKVKYPEYARKQHITGYVLLRFYLDEKGTISQLHVIKAEPPGVFDEAALAAVRQWRFAPAMKNDSPVPYWVELPMPFILK